MTLTLFLLAGTGLSLSAAGMGESGPGKAEEDAMQRAEALVEAKKYDEAIMVLTDYIRRYPQRIDEAQNLIKKIQKIRTAYNSRYEELLYVLYVEEDVEKSLELIEDLEGLDQDPNERTREAVQEARTSARLVYSRKRFREIMNQALDLLAEERYGEAVELYFSGFTLQKEEFDAMDYGEVLKDRVDQAQADMRQAATAFSSEFDTYQAAWQEARELLQNGSVEGLSEDLPLALDTFHLIAQRRKTIYNASAVFERVNEEVQRLRADGKEDFFLSYATRLASGRREVDETEGLSGTVDVLYEKYVSDLTAIAAERSLRLQEQARQAWDRGDWEAAADAFGVSGEYQRWALRTVGLWRDQIYVTREGGVYGEGEVYLERYYPRWAEIQNRLAEARRFQEFLPLREEMAGIETAVPPLEEGGEGAEGIDAGGGADEEELRRRREEISEALARFEREGDDWEERVRRMEEREEAALPLGEVSREASGVSRRLTRVREVLVEKEGAAVTALAHRELAGLARDWQELEPKVVEGQRLADGFEQTVTLGGQEETITSRYPGRARDILTEADENLQGLQSRLEEYLDAYRGEREYLLEREDLQARIERGEKILEASRGLENQTAALLAEVEEDLFEAESVRNEAELRFRQARQSMEAEDFDQARERLTDAQQRFTEALSLQEDLVLRQNIDDRVSSLSEEIVQAENQAVVRDVREYISEGKNAYLQSRYERAEDVLLRAKNRWLVTHNEENEEVNYWYNLVDAALRANTGRTIAETNPLYTEMSQLLSLAYRDFQKAKDLLEEDNRRDALERFDRAEEKLLQVRIPFPQNKRASVLALKIEMLRDPGEARQTLRELFERAKEKLEVNPQEAYVDLTDLQELDPDFPGLSEAIYEAEIALGLRIPPPDPEAQAEARQYVQQAREIYDSGKRAQYSIALQQVNKALELDPNNQAAINLKDSLQIEMGGAATVVMSTQDNARFLEAQELFVEGNYYEALSLVEQLLQNSRNQNYAPLLKLQRRIESKI